MTTTKDYSNNRKGNLFDAVMQGIPRGRKYIFVEEHNA